MNGLETLLAQLQNLIETQGLDMNQRISLESEKLLDRIEDLKSEFSNKFSNFTINVNDILMKEVRYRKRDISDLHLSFQTVKDSVEDLAKKMQANMGDNSDIRRVVQLLVTDTKIQHVMEEVEESDK